MAIEVLNRGQPPSDRVFEGMCTNCRSTLRCTRADVREFQTNQRDGDYGHIECPVCHYMYATVYPKPRAPTR